MFSRIVQAVPMLFPACAGVIPTVKYWERKNETFPRMRGGDPLHPVDAAHLVNFSPHARG